MDFIATSGRPGVFDQEVKALGSKVFYKIGEVSLVTKLPAYVLRFWESQFDALDRYLTQ